MRLSTSQFLAPFLVFAFSVTGAAQVMFCSMKADNTQFVKSAPTKFKTIEGDVKHIEDYVGAEHWMKKKIAYEPWNKIAERFDRDVVKNTSFLPRKTGDKSLLEEPGYQAEMQNLLQKPFKFEWLQGNHVEVLVNGPASFAKRKELIEGARESIHMFAWAFYDDGTGWEFANWLINAKLRRLCDGADLDIKIVVDGNVASGLGYHDVLDFLSSYPAFKSNPIQIIKLKDKRDPYFGMHRKLMMIDRKSMVMGGMNVGDKYSHMFIGQGGKWRDTDIFVTGPVVNQAQLAFVDEWNEQSGKQVLNYKPFDFSSVPGSPDSLSMLVDHQPLRDDNIHILTVKAFYGATKSIDIENAYFVLDPVIENAITDALKRGVHVRILSNSKESIDEPIITVPILKSLARLENQGAEVFTKKVYDGSTTLHSKLLIVDGIFSWIGSFNFHPRSYRYEREVVLASLDKNLAQQFETIFENDLIPAKANRPSSQDLLKMAPGLVNKAKAEAGAKINTKFFDQL